MRNWSRREFMRHAGLAAVFSPFLSILDPKMAKAQAAPGQAKYLFIFFTNGTDVGAWTPRNGSSDGNINFSALTEPLAPLRDRLIIVEQLDSRGTATNHAAPGGLTGKNYDSTPLISLDQFVGDGLRANGIRTQVPSVALGGVPSQSPSVFYRDNRALTAIGSPTTAYQAIFNGALPAAPAGGGDAPPDPRLLKRQRILDVLKGEITQLNQSLGSLEREKLQIHLASLEQLQERVLGGGGGDGGGGAGPIPVACNSFPSQPGDGGQDLLNSVIHMDIAINAFACDITRVAAVEFGHHQGAQVDIPEVGSPGDWHNTFTHGDNPRTRLGNLERWLAGQFVAAADKLKSLPAPDGNGTLFDQTLMIWARDMGDAVIHSGSDMRFVISGGAGGFLRHSPNGRYINGGGDAHARVLFSAIEAMGITNFSGFGNANAPASERSGLPALRA